MAKAAPRAAFTRFGLPYRSQSIRVGRGRADADPRSSACRCRWTVSSRDNDILRETHSRTGANVVGKRMVDAGEHAWPEEAPCHTPVFVVTHEERGPCERPVGTTFHFVNDGIEPALDRAREVAGDRDVRIAGGGATILEYLDAGLVDEFTIALSPVLFDTGIRLFEGVAAGRVALEPVCTEPSPGLRT